MLRAGQASAHGNQPAVAVHRPKGGTTRQAHRSFGPGETPRATDVPLTRASVRSLHGEHPLPPPPAAGAVPASRPPTPSSPARGRRQAFLFSGLVGAALLAIAGVTTMTAAVTDAVRGPQAEIVPPTGDLPPIAAAAYVVVDGDTGEPLASLNADQPRPVASLVKLMTARLVLDAGPLEHTATVPPLQVTGDESQAGLEPGDHVSRGELLQAMLVASANDAARTLAVDVAGDEHSFVRMMNAEAAAAGLDATRYANPVGLDDPAQHSSAADVARLARDLMQDPAFRRIVAAESTTAQRLRAARHQRPAGCLPGRRRHQDRPHRRSRLVHRRLRHPRRPQHRGRRPRRPHRTSPRRRRPRPPRLRRHLHHPPSRLGLKRPSPGWTRPDS